MTETVFSTTIYPALFLAAEAELTTLLLTPASYMATKQLSRCVPSSGSIFPTAARLFLFVLCGKVEGTSARKYV